MFTLPDNCSYVVATDGCNGELASYSVIARKRSLQNNPKAIVINSLDIKFNGLSFTIDSRFRINGNYQTLPYSGNGVFVSKKISDTSCLKRSILRSNLMVFNI
jgi:hypothetical protein